MQILLQNPLRPTKESAQPKNELLLLPLTIGIGADNISIGKILTRVQKTSYQQYR